jgi:hypothetical protein
MVSSMSNKEELSKQYNKDIYDYVNQSIIQDLEKLDGIFNSVVIADAF